MKWIRPLPFAIIIMIAGAVSPADLAAGQVNSTQITPEPGLIGPATKVTVFIADSDLDANPSSIDKYDAEDIELVTFRSDRSELDEATPDLEETSKNTGVFEFTIQLTTDEESCNNDLFIDPSFAAKGGSHPSIGVCPGDILSIRYEDSHTASGGEAVNSFSLEIKSWDPEFSTDKDHYLPGDRVGINLIDPDANRDPDIIDSIEDVRVYSDSDPAGEQFSAIETGRNTGAFKLTFATSLENPGNSILVEDGDALSVEYTDEYPANFTVSERTNTFVLSIGSITDGIVLDPSPLKPDAAGTLAAGNQITLSTTLTSYVEQPQPFVELVEVRNSDGLTVFLAWQSGVIEPLGQTHIGALWTPLQRGYYTARTFAVSSFDNPQVLSSVEESSISIA